MKVCVQARSKNGWLSGMARQSQEPVRSAQLLVHVQSEASFAVHVGLRAWDITHGGVDCLPENAAAISTSVAIAQGAESYICVA
eukprot:6491856-Amphidinium_carterae.1